MPRQLPWATKGATSRTQVEPTKFSSTAASRIFRNEDDFFEDTVSAPSNTGQGRASSSDDDLPNLPAEPAIPRAKSKPKDACRKRHEESSSPPPMTEDLEQPPVERMHKGISKFDLRDDEWMMVEDEFLETAKLFTRHLHIAEYERLKEIIEEKKKSAGVARPVVANATMSVDGTMKKKAELQEKQQKRAIRDVFASHGEEEEKRRTISSTHVALNTHTHLSSATKRALANTPKTKPRAAWDSDSEDLDTLRPPVKPPLKFVTTASTKINSPASGSKVVSSPTPTTTTAASSSTFAKPAPPPTSIKARSRISRTTPFDMLDDWVPKKSQTSPKASPEQPVKSRAACRTPVATKPSRSFDSFGNPELSMYTRLMSSPNETKTQQRSYETSSRSGDVADRLAKRKAECEKNDRDKKKKTLEADDIPTFLF